MGSWREIYEHAVKQQPAVQYIYDAIDILRQAGISLFLFVVEPTALSVWGGNDIQRILRKRHIQRALHYLTQEKRILRHTNDELTPSDGQIEVRSEAIRWQPYAADLERLLLQLAKTHKEKVNNSLFEFGVAAYYEGQFDWAEILWRKRLETGQNDSAVWSNLGVVLFKQKRYAEAEAAYRQAIEKDPNDAAAYSNLGNLLSDKKLERYAEAEAAYRQAIEKDPNYAAAYSNLGILLKKLERYAEAEAAYRQAIEKDPNDAAAYSNLGLLLHEKLERYAEAEAAYRQAIEKDPNYAAAYSNLGNLLSDKKLERYAEAEAAYRQAIEKDPNLDQAYNNLAIMLCLIGRGQDAIPVLEKLMELTPNGFNPYLGIASIQKHLGEIPSEEYLIRVRAQIPNEDWYNRACLESVCGNLDAAFDNLVQAAQQDKFDRAWAWQDPDFEWLRADSRFTEIVGPLPEK